MKKKKKHYFEKPADGSYCYLLLHVIISACYYDISFVYLRLLLHVMHSNNPLDFSLKAIIFQHAHDFEITSHPLFVLTIRSINVSPKFSKCHRNNHINLINADMQVCNSICALI